MLAALLVACTGDIELPDFEHARLLDPARSLPEFTLTDQFGRPFTRVDLEDRWTVLFSGFTHCPDVCPATLSVLQAAQRERASEGAIRTVFVTVDPDRDTPERLQDYLRWFEDDWIGLSGPKSSLDTLLDAMQMASVRVPLGDGQYTMDHATAIVLIDPSARAVAYWPAPQDADRLAEDLRRLPTP